MGVPRPSRNTSPRVTQASTFYVAGSTTTLSGSVVDNTSTRTVKVTPSGETVNIYAGPTATIGQLQLSFTQKGDTLVLPNYSGAQFKLIRR